MNYAAFLLVIYAVAVRGFGIEEMDREYYMIVNKTQIFPEDNQVKHKNEMSLDTPALKIEFKEIETEKKLNKYPSLIERMDRLLALSNTELVHTDNNNKITLVPFKNIRLTNDDGEINVGYYKGSYIKNLRIVQEYANGDTCDICKSKKWSGSIHYIPDSGHIELSGPVENSTCNYKLIVKGEELGTEEKCTLIHIIGTAVGEPSTNSETENKTACTESSCPSLPGIQSTSEDKDKNKQENTPAQEQEKKTTEESIKEQISIRDDL